MPRRSQVSLVLKCQLGNLISEQQPKWVGTLTRESRAFGPLHVWIAHNGVRPIQRCRVLFLILHLRNSCNQINNVQREVYLTHICGICSPFTTIRPKMVFLEYLDRGSTLMSNSSLCFSGCCQNVQLVSFLFCNENETSAHIKISNQPYYQRASNYIIVLFVLSEEIKLINICILINSPFSFTSVV